MYILFSGLIIRKTYIHTHHLILKTEEKKEKKEGRDGLCKGNSNAFEHDFDVNKNGTHI